jgi:uncharacterized membrane protein
MTDVLVALTVLTALGCGVVAGVFFAFSTFVMKALSRLPPAAGVAAMQAINAAAIPSTFFLTGLGTMLGCVALAGWAVVEWHEPFTPYLLAGSALYLAGSMVVTVAFNLPRNDALATVHPEGAEAADRWTRYLAEWTVWNHVRAAGALAASAALIGAILAAE